MSDDFFDGDEPFGDDDSAARAARRREREARRGGGRAERGEIEGEPEPEQSAAGEFAGADFSFGFDDEDRAEARSSLAGRVASFDDALDSAPPPVGEEPRRSEQPRSMSGDETAIWRRRLLAAGIFLAVIGGITLLSRGGGSEAPPAAAPPAEFTVTIPEGLTREQVADDHSIVGDLRGDYLADTKSAKAFPGFKPEKYTGGETPDSLEGFLFPATYNLFEDSSTNDLIERQLDAFSTTMDEINLDDAAAKNLTAYDIVIIASMIEKEIAVPKERKLAAAVIYNRLSAGEPLHIDATIRYALAKYDGQLTESDLAVDSPFNTATNPGLPPAPIANPGKASLEAAAHPADSDVYYYVIKPGSCNEHTFTASLDEFNAAVAEYQAALAAAGGSPTDCG